MKWNAQYLVFLIFVVLTTAVAAAGYVLAPPQLPIWYSLSVSEQQLDQKIFLFMYPLSIGIIALLDVLFIRLTTTIDSVLPKMIVWTSLIPMSIITIALIHSLLIVL